MNNATKAALLKTYELDYDALPKIKKTLIPKNIKYLRRFVSAIATMTVIVPIVRLSSRLLILRSATFFLTEKKITPFAEQRLKEKEKKVQDMAKTVGIKHPNKMKVALTKQNIGGVAAAAGKSLVLIASNALLTTDDLPEELKLNLLDQGKMTEEEWVLKFAKWRYNKVFTKDAKTPKSQAEVDLIVAFNKMILHQMRNQKDRDQMFDAILAHELGHSKKNDTRKLALASFGLDLLALPTLGVSTLFKNRVFNKYSRKLEKEADMFSVKANKSADGLIKLFQDCLEMGKTLQSKYPKWYDAQGNNKGDSGHPKTTKRISYLKQAF